MMQIPIHFSLNITDTLIQPSVIPALYNLLQKQATMRLQHRNFMCASKLVSTEYLLNDFKLF